MGVVNVSSARGFPRLGPGIGALLLCSLVLLALPVAARAALSWTGPAAIDPQASGVALNRIACPSVTQCTTVDGRGQAVTFNPQAPHGLTTAIVSTHNLSGIACPSTTQCTAVDINGEETTFDPQSTSGGTPVTVDPTGIPLGLACPSATQCTAVDGNGAYVTFDPQSPGQPAAPTEIDPNRILVSVQCPGGSTSWCVATDTSGGAVAFAPVGAPAAQGPVQVDGHQVQAAACSPAPSSAQCAAVDTVGGGSAFTAKADAPPQPGSNGPVDQTDAGVNALTAMSCPSDAECVAVDGQGNESMFDPQSLLFGAPIPVEKGEALSDVACPSTTQCTAVDRNGQEVTFNPNPQQVGTPTPAPVDGHTDLVSLACPSTGSCAALDIGGTEVTFTPGSSAAPATAGVDRSGGGAYALACPSIAQCTAVDSRGREVTFDQSAPGQPTPTTIAGGHTLYGVACPSTTQCTAVDDSGDAVTFDPRAPGRTSSAGVDSGHALSAIACPSAEQCTAIDDSGAEVTFDPLSPGRARPHLMDRVPDTALSCPASFQCTAVDGSGDEVTFNPQRPSQASALAVDPNHQLTGIACRTLTGCVTVDQSGRALEGDPRGVHAWTVRRISGSALAAVQCPSALRCVAVDQPGNAFVGSSGPLPPVPRGRGRPVVAGTALQGRTLSSSEGRWSPAPSSYTYQWQRCSAAGRRCRPIPGATAATYELSAADVGHRIRVRVRGWNITGGGTAPPSTLTAVVRLSLELTRTSLSGVSAGTPRLVFALRSGGGALRIRRIALILAPGLAMRGTRGMSLSGGPYAATARGRRVMIVLHPATNSAAVVLGEPGLSATPQLVRAVRRRSVHVLDLSLWVTQQSGHTSHFSLTLT